MHHYYNNFDTTSSLTKLPPEIIHQIISKLDINSTGFLLDFINTLIALNYKDFDNNNTEYLSFQNLINHFQNKILVIDLTDKVAKLNTPLLKILRNSFLLENNNNLNLNTLQKIVLLVDDQSETLIDPFEQFESIQSNFTNFSIDLVYCPTSSNSSVIKVLSFFSKYFTNFNNLILEFEKTTLTTNRTFFDILSYDFFTFNSTANNSKHILVPRCKQISFPSIIELNMDYLTIDSFIYKILENNNIHLPTTTNLDENINSISFIENLFNSFLKNLKFYIPNLKIMKFYNYNDEETCNFIDLSSLMLNKFKDNSCPLKYLFDLHSFKNWSMQNLIYFTGHRFKYDESKISGSTERLKRSLRDNIKLLHEIAIDETIDATPYFRVNLIPPGVKVTKIINWLPSESINISNNQSSTSFIDNEFDDSNNNIAPSDLSERKQNQNYFNKPILCLKNDSLISLELKLLTIGKSSKTIYIHGLFLQNLKELILQNFNTVIKKTKISDKRNSIILLSPTNSNQSYNFSPVNSNQSNDSISLSQSDNPDIDEIHPIGFSSWNNLPNCEFLQFTLNQNKIPNLNQNQINFLFKIRNLKLNVPKINLTKSFDNFIDERQQYIIV